MSDASKTLTVPELEALLARCEPCSDFDMNAYWKRALAAVCRQALAQAAAIDHLQAFKDWCHSYLDAHGVPHHPPGSHGTEGCRIGDRMDWLVARLRAAESGRDRLREALRALLLTAQEAKRENTPEFMEWLELRCGEVRAELAKES
jgi:hypothetical protein